MPKPHPQAKQVRRALEEAYETEEEEEDDNDDGGDTEVDSDNLQVRKPDNNRRQSTYQSRPAEVSFRQVSSNESTALSSYVNVPKSQQHSAIKTSKTPRKRDSTSNDLPQSQPRKIRKAQYEARATTSKTAGPSAESLPSWRAAKQWKPPVGQKRVISVMRHILWSMSAIGMNDCTTLFPTYQDPTWVEESAKIAWKLARRNTLGIYPEMIIAKTPEDTAADYVSSKLMNGVDGAGLNCYRPANRFVLSVTRRTGASVTWSVVCVRSRTTNHKLGAIGHTSGSVTTANSSTSTRALAQ